MKYLTYTVVLLTGFIAGFLVEWWNSPISRPLCLDKGVRTGVLEKRQMISGKGAAPFVYFKAGTFEQG